MKLLHIIQTIPVFRIYRYVFSDIWAESQCWISMSFFQLEIGKLLTLPKTCQLLNFENLSIIDFTASCHKQSHKPLWCISDRQHLTLSTKVSIDKLLESISIATTCFWQCPYISNCTDFTSFCKFMDILSNFTDFFPKSNFKCIFHPIACAYMSYVSMFTGLCLMSANWLGGGPCGKFMSYMW